MQTSPPWRAKIELALTKLGLLVIPPLPRCVILMLARVLAIGAWVVASRERRVGLANLDLAFGDTKTMAEKRAILRESFRTFARMLLDVFWFSRHTRERVERWLEYDPSMQPLWQIRATVGITAHLGNWELLGQVVAMRGFPLVSVVAPLANPAVDTLFRSVRATSGQEITPQQGAVRQQNCNLARPKYAARGGRDFCPFLWFARACLRCWGNAGAQNRCAVFLRLLSGAAGWSL